MNHLFYRKKLPFEKGDRIGYLGLKGEIIGFGQGITGAVTCKVLLDGAELLIIPSHKYGNIKKEES